MSLPLWTPSAAFATQSHLARYQQWLANEYQLSFPDYQALHRWSVQQLDTFWQSIARFFELQTYRPATQTRNGLPMPHTRWFCGATLNYAEHLMRGHKPEQTALIYRREDGLRRSYTWAEIRKQTALLQAQMRLRGFATGHRAAAYLPNCPEAAVGLLATTALGGVWSSVSPDFGVQSAIDRFGQIEPRVLFVTDGYWYGGKWFDKWPDARALAQALPSVHQVYVVPADQASFAQALPQGWQLWHADTDTDLPSEPEFVHVEFNEALWVLYSSGTTGKPKAITHSHGGALLEHYKYLALHQNVHAGQVFFWYTTTGWMMWNYTLASWLCGATVVLYDGSPSYPHIDSLWQLAQQEEIAHFGTSAPYLAACAKAGVQPRALGTMPALVSVGSTGSPLADDSFDWVYRTLGPDIWLCSISGGTDVCSAFVGGNPMLPVYRGQIQCRALGCDLEAWDDNGHPLIGQLGEMVVRQPMPSMPIYFWNDTQYERYLESYFGHYPGVWRHGDWVRIGADGTVQIQGRSDATLNRHGVRIGTSELYSALQQLPELTDALVIDLETGTGQSQMLLFVCLQPQAILDATIQQRIRQHLRQTCSPRHVPDHIWHIPELPYTLSGKKMETPAKRILQGQQPDDVSKKDAVRNPAALAYFYTHRQAILRLLGAEA